MARELGPRSWCPFLRRFACQVRQTLNFTLSNELGRTRATLEEGEDLCQLLKLSPNKISCAFPHTHCNFQSQPAGRGFLCNHAMVFVKEEAKTKFYVKEPLLSI